MKVCEVVLAIFGGKFDPKHETFGISTHVLGNIRDERLLAACYNAADVFVIPSLEDNLPNTVLESMACETPVVAFETGGIPEMVSHLQTGLLVKRKDANALAEQLQWIIEHPRERARMARTPATSSVKNIPPPYRLAGISLFIGVSQDSAMARAFLGGDYRSRWELSHRNCCSRKGMTTLSARLANMADTMEQEKDFGSPTNGTNSPLE